jgi:hypothetical protein
MAMQPKAIQQGDDKGVLFIDNTINKAQVIALATITAEQGEVC